MKRFAPVFLALILVASLAACDSKTTPSGSVSPSGSLSPSASASPSVSQSPDSSVPSPQVSIGFDDEESTWGDASFEKLIRVAMSIPDGDIDPQLTMAVKKLSIMPKDDKVEVKIDDNAPVSVEMDKPIKTLEDLARFGGLTDLAVGYAELQTIDHITFLAQMFGMSYESITVTNAGISDISSFAMLTTLKSLDLSGNEISDISPLTALPGLETLNVSGNPLSDPTQVGLFEGVDVTY